MNSIKRIIYVSCILPPEKEKDMITVNPQAISIQAYKYHRLLAEGFVKNGIEVCVISYQKYMKSINIKNGDHETINGVEYYYIVPGKEGKISYLDLFLKVFSHVKRMCKESNTVVLCDVLNLTISYAAYTAAQKTKTDVVGIVTDFPAMSKKQINSKLTWRLIGKCTKWVLLTEQMYEYLHKKKPAVIMEGHVDGSMLGIDNSLKEKDRPRRCIYAGGLSKKFGIETLVEAFKMADICDAELHLYGKGDYVESLQTNVDKRIVYHGIVSNDIVVRDELRATLLINPRPTIESFTKYSFPSKNMEYMASGTPVLTTKLPGMPKEYYDYVYLFDDETVKGMAETLKKVLSLSDDELHSKGISAREFVFQEKTNAKQAKRIIDLIERE